jgi:multiple sugar transport system permease protein
MKKQKFMMKSFVYLLLLLGATVTTIPFIYMVSTAFKGQTYVFELPPKLIPADPTVQNFTDAWNSNNFQIYFLNSLFVSIFTTLLILFVSSMLAFAFARFHFFGKKLLFALILVTLMIPSMMLIIPQFILAKNLGLLNSLWGLVFVYVAMNIAVNTFLLRGFFEGIPKELEDATRIDGGGFFTIFFRVVLPLSKPALAPVAILYGPPFL